MPRPAFGPQDHHSPAQRRVAELLAAREKAFAAKDERWIKNYTAQIEGAMRDLKPNEKNAVHQAVRDGSAKRD